MFGHAGRACVQLGACRGKQILGFNVGERISSRRKPQCSHALLACTAITNMHMHAKYRAECTHACMHVNIYIYDIPIKHLHLFIYNIVGLTGDDWHFSKTELRLHACTSMHIYACRVGRTRVWIICAHASIRQECRHTRWFPNRRRLAFTINIGYMHAYAHAHAHVHIHYRTGGKRTHLNRAYIDQSRVQAYALISERLSIHS